MNIALVHDYLVQDGGAERVLLALHEMFPEAPIYTLFYDPKFVEKRFKNATIIPSFLQKFPKITRIYQWLLPIMPLATESYHFKENTNLIISSTSAFAKGIIPPTNCTHISYIHTPTRFLWTDSGRYVQELKVPKFIKFFLPPILHRLRAWDTIASTRPDILIGNSQTVVNRIKTFYKKEAQCIYPPVETSKALPPQAGEYFITGGRLVYYKHVDLAIECCNRLHLPLVVYGDGPEMERLKKMAGETITFVGKISDEEKWKLLSKAKAFINPQNEDFGITAVESMAAGKPVIALRQGGATETVQENVTGVFFDNQTWEALCHILGAWEKYTWNSDRIIEHAKKFDTLNFKKAIRTLVESI